MPHTRSAEKHLRQTQKRRVRNKARIRAIKADVKSFLSTAKSGSPADLQKAYNAAAKSIDKAAAKRTIHPNAAARKKSKLAKLMNAAKSR